MQFGVVGLEASPVEAVRIQFDGSVRRERAREDEALQLALCPLGVQRGIETWSCIAPERTHPLGGIHDHEGWEEFRIASGFWA